MQLAIGVPPFSGVESLNMAAGMRRSIVSFNQKISKISSKFVLPERLRGGYVEKTVKYFEMVAQDYKVAIQDGVTDAQARPFKAAAYTGGGLLTVASIATNPTEVDYVAQQTEWCNEMATCSKSIRSHKAEQYLQRISGDYAPTCQLYQAQCAFYEPTFFELISERLVDIGIFGRWWLINRKMLNYDINDQEFVTR